MQLNQTGTHLEGGIGIMYKWAVLPVHVIDLVIAKLLPCHICTEFSNLFGAHSVLRVWTTSKPDLLFGAEVDKVVL